MSDDRIRIQVDEMLTDLIPRYLSNREAETGMLRTAIDAGDWELSEMIGHKMKGSGGGYGFDRITDLGEVIERGSQQRNTVSVAQALDDLIDYLDRVEPVFVEED
ncbi:MAG: Hpt domain-containing protein [Actinomycetota bacterium]|nr:Hpt domain-containing protein [Actinomycetota bacterium]